MKNKKISEHTVCPTQSVSPDGGMERDHDGVAVAGALSQVGSQRLQHLPKIACTGGQLSADLPRAGTSRTEHLLWTQLCTRRGVRERDGQNFAN